jgi:hypothetical protein
VAGPGSHGGTAALAGPDGGPGVTVAAYIRTNRGRCTGKRPTTVTESGMTNLNPGRLTCQWFAFMQLYRQTFLPLTESGFSQVVHVCMGHFGE